jgi:glycosyltransferase involved in cell wall biosynthesis
MAAFAHEIAVAGVHGRATDDVLKAHPDALLLTPAADAAAYARAVVELAADPERLRAMGSAGRRLYEREFDWPVLADTVTSALRHGETVS